MRSTPLSGPGASRRPVCSSSPRCRPLARATAAVPLRIQAAAPCAQPGWLARPRHARLLAPPAACPLPAWRRLPCAAALPPLPARRLRCPPPPAAAARGGGGGAVPAGLASLPLLGPAIVALEAYTQRVSALSGRFLPMLSLFFLLSFANTLLDSLKDSLVITAAGGGAAVLPFLSVYAVLPASLAFFVAYSAASHRFGRTALFNGIVAAFGAFFLAFAVFLMPNAHTLHQHAFADALQQVLPVGLSGAVGMVRNWTFTLFFCASELWGDVCCGVLFWNLANDTTSLAEAPTLYPLFGLGANMAQALAGLVLKASCGSGNFVREVQTTLAVVLAMAAAAVVVHGRISSRAARPARQAVLPPRPGSRAATLAAAAAAAGHDHGSAASVDVGDVGSAEDFAALLEERRRSSGAASSSGGGANGAAGSGAAGGARGSSSGSSSSYGAPAAGVGSNGAVAGSGSSGAADPHSEPQHPHSGAANGHTIFGGVPMAGADDVWDAALAPQQQQQQQQQQGQQRQRLVKVDEGPDAAPKHPPGLQATLALLAASVEIRALAVMSLAQGLATSLMEFCWKSHIRLLYPAPSDFTAFLGDVATWTGVSTAALMLASPLLFERLGWRGVAGATPKILLYGGSAFFGAAIAYQHFFARAHAAAAAAGAAHPATGTWLLVGVVFGGALLYVWSKGAKFSLFKPAEEMVYLCMDEEGRTRGKAAIDVVGSQTGKSGGSLLQQALLVVSAGAISGPILPILFVVYFGILRGWLDAVRDLSARRRYTLNSPMHSLEEEDPWPQPGAAGAAVVAAPPRPEEVAARLEAAELAARLRELQRGRGGVGA
ncbi:hypothetical protein Rsub_09772 [Raphidocelis subcapitata]|uniref:ADP,ATP carrier protein n=1 Tax=Raphidocelis subcapitata TaxID=307507 RepID=A0A2V0PIV3_9CHLO|nr:hypothetical protein Rsub_09772 [Raphidocelis subcapitata]|eukprot:GBF96975.1 hypothetical protein Rsub_09772 [Raphidocelis subcapitata]